MAGGVALNCVANGRIARESGLTGLFIQPAAGGALGAALLVSHQLLGALRRTVPQGDTLQGSCFGPAFAPHEVAAFLEREGAPYERVEDANQRAGMIADTLAEGKVVGLLSGRMEFGPRARGVWSILGDARRRDMRSTMNMRIKFRESFRPIAPAVLAEKSSEYFELAEPSPYMLLVAQLNKDGQIPMEAPVFAGDDMMPILRQARSDVPAVAHVDYSAGVQTVTADNQPELHRILRAFQAKTGCSLVINTSWRTDRPFTAGH